MMDAITVALMIILFLSFCVLYLMNVRIKQLRKELNDLKDRITITSEELLRLSNDIEEFKKINI
ncbi:MAG: Spo0E family sporulation regulatory protein-aspartic acid phosphatase [Candidatus Methanoperedens sp.]|nr:Spo0E family sporulation regulatory protein-aspartic acid phosphatase [Candidatus Methanoperedens sp.]